MNRAISARLAIAIVLAAVQLSGCASTLTEEEQYEKDALRAERMDEILGFIMACDNAGYTVFYNGSKKHKLLDPIKRIPGNAHLSDYTCASPEDIERFLHFLRGSGLGM